MHAWARPHTAPHHHKTIFTYSPQQQPNQTKSTTKSSPKKEEQGQEQETRYQESKKFKKKRRETLKTARISTQNRPIPSFVIHVRRGRIYKHNYSFCYHLSFLSPSSHHLIFRLPNILFKLPSSFPNIGEKVFGIVCCGGGSLFIRKSARSFVLLEALYPASLGW